MTDLSLQASVIQSLVLRPQSSGLSHSVFSPQFSVFRKTSISGDFQKIHFLKKTSNPVISRKIHFLKKHPNPVIFSEIQSFSLDFQ